MTVSEIAAEFGVDRSNVSRWRRIGACCTLPRKTSCHKGFKRSARYQIAAHYGKEKHWVDDYAAQGAPTSSISDFKIWFTGVEHRRDWTLNAVARRYKTTDETARSWRADGAPWGDDKKLADWVALKFGQTAGARKQCAICLYKCGLGIKRIKRRLRVSQTTVYHWICEAGVLDPDRQKKFIASGALSSIIHNANARAGRTARPRWDINEIIRIHYDKESSAFVDWSRHPEVVRWQALRYYYKNHEKGKANSRSQAKKQWERRKKDGQWMARRNAKSRLWRADNRDVVNEWTRTQRKTNPQFKIASIIRGRIGEAIKSRYAAKTAKSMELVGCGWGELRLHIERQWRRGMSWDNHGLRGWHVDHIVPVCAFDLTNPQEQRRAFHYTNLRPIWAKENLSKGGKVWHTECLIDLYAKA